ncbi:hypothetical protein E4V01_21945 [Methylorubrum sp. Q1]|uniref:hypothetical protein n=1 Tax=Methylorubrum sp. Q1 TaxID=2562453 RepID=UPI0010760D80|nr:hypothetical protein [Methylorubrum sp. Q1]TFZ55588.1 hypothetical protein E4V01_21945 [Methylorubrum sp. Q1]
MSSPSNAIVSLLKSVGDRRDALRQIEDTWFVEGGKGVWARVAERALSEGFIEKTQNWPGVRRFGCFSATQKGIAAARAATAREG